MKILNLEIKNIRGIKSFIHAPKGENIVVFGPNGTGKSAIVDAVDFLLSGKISRLSGKGSGCLYLNQHGCHVDSRDALKDTVVSADIEIDGKKVSIERSINRPSSLKINPKSEKELIESYLQVASLGQHVLSRREIVRYITAEPSERAKDIQNLLDLNEIEKLRSALVSVQTDAKNEYKYKQSNLEVAKKNVINLLSIPSFTQDACLKKINELRTLLQGNPLKEIDLSKFKDGLAKKFGEPDGKILTKAEIENNIKDVKDFSKKEEEFERNESELKIQLGEVLKDEKLKQYSLYKRLFEAGISLVDDRNICPLCGREWTEGNLKEVLELRKKEAEIAKDKQDKIDELSSAIKTQIELLKNNVSILLNATKQLKISTIEQNEDREYLELLDNWSATMINPLESYENKKWPEVSLKDVFTSKLLKEKLMPALEEALQKEGGQSSKELEAWDTLTKLEVNWRSLQEASIAEESAVLFKKRADACIDYFEKARNSVLDGIYDNVKGSFDKYYKEVHSSDEDDFTSKLSHEGASLNFEVDFYGRGMFPPHALHSEGHQDSMGLCLFFALNEYLTKDAIKVIILDDVVMSIDRNHRKDICKLLKNFFPDKQFLITTHDTAWAKQLQTEGIVGKRNMIHFLNWNIETGPTFRLEKDLWQKIDEDLQNDDVPSAAHKLRWNAECFFEDICDLLIAKVPYKGNHQWELEDFASSAIFVYREYLKKAKENFNKLNQQNKVKELCDLEKMANEIIEKSKIEQWIINANVHYNKWAECSKNDFTDVVSAFKNLFALFSCSNCGQSISVTQRKGDSPKAILSCECQNISWNVS